MHFNNTEALQLMKQTPLFAGFTSEQILQITELMSFRVKTYGKGEMMVVAGDTVETAGLILKGRAQILTAPNLDGSQALIAEIGLGEMYSEPFNCLSYKSIPITVSAKTPCEVLLFDVRDLFSITADAPLKLHLLRNAVNQFAEKIIVFRNKIEVLSQPTLKMKVLTTVKHHAEYQGVMDPVIPFTKSEFAEYLCVNRNSLSATLKELTAEGELAIEGKHYHLLKPENMLFNQRDEHVPASGIHTRY